MGVERLYKYFRTEEGDGQTKQTARREMLLLPYASARPLTPIQNHYRMKSITIGIANTYVHMLTCYYATNVLAVT